MSPIYVPGKVVLDSGNQPTAIAGVAPTLDYRFARDKREIETVSLTDKLSYSRAALCTYVDSGRNIRLAQANEPRFTYNLTDSTSEGLLFELSRTNSFLQSNNPAQWSLLGSAGRENGFPDPFGGTSASRIIIGGNNIESGAKLSGATTNAIYTVSVFVKKGTQGSKVSIYQANSPYYGVYDFNFDNPTGNFIRYPNGWFRVWFTYSASSSVNGVTIGSYVGANMVIGDNFLVCGAQYENGNTLTSFIQTGASAVTRTETGTINGTGVITGTYTMVEKPEGCASVSAGNIVLNDGYTIQRIMVFPAALSAQQITDIRSAM
jgi:hypothetical protein